MNRRFEDLEEEYVTGFFFAEKPDEIAFIHMEAMMEFRNRVAQDQAEQNAYKICGCCRRIYTKEQWEQLPPPANGILRKADEWELAEYRNCQTLMPTGELCDSTLAVVLQVYGGEPLKNSRVVEEQSGTACECSACRKPIALGQHIWVRIPRLANRQQAVRQVFCEECEKFTKVVAKIEGGR